MKYEKRNAYMEAYHWSNQLKNVKGRGVDDHLWASFLSRRKTIYAPLPESLHAEPQDLSHSPDSSNIPPDLIDFVLCKRAAIVSYKSSRVHNHFFQAFLSTTSPSFNTTGAFDRASRINL